tara:strand:- start:459 stop:641 length:183 start_codon:yes stop_codon:yes gene_type:complete
MTKTTIEKLPDGTYRVEDTIFDNYEEAKMYEDDIENGLDRNGFGIPNDHPDAESEFYDLD